MEPQMDADGRARLQTSRSSFPLATRHLPLREAGPSTDCADGKPWLPYSAAAWRGRQQAVCSSAPFGGACPERSRTGSGQAPGGPPSHSPRHTRYLPQMNTDEHVAARPQSKRTSHGWHGTPADGGSSGIQPPTPAVRPPQPRLLWPRQLAELRRPREGGLRISDIDPQIASLPPLLSSLLPLA